MLARLGILALLALLMAPGAKAQPAADGSAPADGGRAAMESDGPPARAIQAAKLIYGGGKSSICFAEHFLTDFQEQTGLETEPTLSAVRADSGELYNYPFVVMTGEGAFELAEEERDNLRQYLDHGGFLVASAGCSSRPWDDAFHAAFAHLYPERELETLSMDHPVFSTVYKVRQLKSKRTTSEPTLQALILDGRVALIYSGQGLNDTANVGDKSCCCCGGSELLNAKPVNVNLLAYALTH